MLEIIGWVVVIALFVVGMAGAVYPILPGALAIYAAYFVYGLCISFSPFGFWFWLIQTLIVVVLFVADYAVNAWGVKKFGGSRASIIGSTIGVIIGPFVIPAFGLILGPLIGAVLGELFVGSDLNKSLKVGFGSVVGLFTSTVVKFALQLAMIVLFVIWLI
ncbi:DUF456 domain-containing protein [Paenibacillus sp. MMS18-CY102]|uniref:DUF456 domain-containing protein n=1 Tax=Paenibacillus sp. MMS18-CY102 TaxID=2682849 RepID=UPI0013665FFA|nr:DUF456 family protein [Paenibacillus sp. MMS18-CY102]MWC29544.1 DUF456 family protein [Paenibacillus sp. MMS18-CY102]